MDSLAGEVTLIDRGHNCVIFSINQGNTFVSPDIYPFEISVIRGHSINSTSLRCFVLLLLVVVVILETAYFNVQTIREIKIENRKLDGKKKVSSVFTQYVCFCVFVCLSSIYRRTYI